MRATTISTLAAVVILAAAAPAARAQDYCVTCTGPDAKYHCIIGGDASLSARSSRGQMLCITELAQRGGHASCSVSRSSTEPCNGQVKTVMFPPGETVPQPMPDGYVPPPAAPPAAALAPAAPMPDAPGAAPPVPPQALAPGAEPNPGAPPPTESTNGLKKAGDAVTKTVENTGKAIGHAASKTWKCLATFFGDC